LNPGLPKLNPGLKLANTFGVKIGQENKKLLVCLKDSLIEQLNAAPFPRGICVIGVICG